jgi:hypothetical protein
MKGVNLMTLPLSLLIVLSLSNNLNAQTQASNLQLETKLTEQKICIENHLYVYRLSFELIYTNMGTKTLILYKGSNSISYVRVARHETDLAEKKYEIDMSVSWYTSGRGSTDAGYAPDERFKVLKPGKSFKTYGKSSILTETPLAAGEHIMQIIIPTWDDTEQQYQTLKARWHKTGELWARNAFSIPTKLLIEENRKLKKC